MIQAELTPNLAGILLRGDFLDLNGFIETVYQLALIPDDQKDDHETLHLMALAVAYEVRHALQGDRGLALIDNGVNNEIKKARKMLLPNQTVYYEARIDIITAVFVVAALEYFMRPLKPYSAVRATMLQYQAAVLGALHTAISEKSYHKVERNIVDFFYRYDKDYCIQYLEEQTAKYLRMDRDKRLKALPGTLVRVLEMGDPYHQTVQDIKVTAAYYGCTVKEIKLNKGWEYPEEFEW